MRCSGSAFQSCWLVIYFVLVQRSLQKDEVVDRVWYWKMKRISVAPTSCWGSDFTSVLQGVAAHGGGTLQIVNAPDC